jgi:hypothetical protein
MDLIAVRKFRDPKSRIPLANQQCKCHVPKGAQFTIGGDVQDLAKIPDDREREFLASLLFSRAVVPASPAAIAAVALELEQDRKREAHFAAMDVTAGARAANERFQALVEAAARVMPEAAARAPARR